MLDVGTEAPDFTLKDQNGQAVTLGSFDCLRNKLTDVLLNHLLLQRVECGLVMRKGPVSRPSSSNP